MCITASTYVNNRTFERYCTSNENGYNQNATSFKEAVLGEKLFPHLYPASDIPFKGVLPALQRTVTILCYAIRINRDSNTVPRRTKCIFRYVLY